MALCDEMVLWLISVKKQEYEAFASFLVLGLK